MRPTPKTIQIFLPGGDPQGIRIAEITTRIVQAIDVPRTLLGDFFAMPESGQVALYFLVGDADGSDPHVYIGQTGDLKNRLAKHHRDKDFWQRALVVVSRTNSLTQTHALFLEWYCLTACRQAGRYPDENGNSGSKPHTPAPLEADCLEIFDTARTLLATLGYPVFDPVAKRDEHAGDDEVFLCTGPGADGRGLYTNEGFVVLQGSVARKETVPSLGESYARQRTRLVEQGVLTDAGDRYVFQRDHLFNSPSTAAMVVMGRRANGWLEWKSSSGRTLDELKRQSNSD